MTYQESPLFWSVKHSWNAWSSLFYSIIPANSTNLKIPTFILGVVSFTLWSGSDFPAIHFFDITAMMWVILATTINALPDNSEKQIVLSTINVKIVVFIFITFLLKQSNAISSYYNSNIMQLIAIETYFSSIILFCFHFRNKLFYASLFCFLIGYACKMFTVFFDYYHGTAFFHTFTALGIYILNSKYFDNRSTDFMKIPQVYVRKRKNSDAGHHHLESINI